MALDSGLVRAVVEYRDDEATHVEVVERELVAARLRAELALAKVTALEHERRVAIGALARLTEICIGHEAEVGGDDGARTGPVEDTETGRHEPAGARHCFGAQKPADSGRSGEGRRPDLSRCAQGREGCCGRGDGAGLDGSV